MVNRIGQVKFFQLVYKAWVWRRLVRIIPTFCRSLASLRAGWERSLDTSKIMKVLAKLRGVLPNLTGQLGQVQSLQSYSANILQVLVVVQLALAPVLLFSFPLLHINVGLMIVTSYNANPSCRKPEWWLMILGLLYLLSGFLGADFHWEDPNLWQWQGGLLLAVLVAGGFSAEFAGKVLRYLVFTSVIWLAVGFVQVWAGAPTPASWLGAGQARVILVRSYSVFGNPNVFAIYLLTIIGLAAGFTRPGAESPAVRLTAGVILLLSLGALYFTYSRTGWLLAMVFLWFWLGSILPVKRRFLLYLAGGLLLGTLVGFQTRVLDLLLLRDSSLLYRFRIWKGVVKALREYWLWGTGPGGFVRVYPEFQFTATPGQHPHSFYWQVWLEYGLTGISAWFCFCRIIWHRITGNSADRLIKATAAAWLLFLGSGLTESWQASRFCNGYFWLLTGILLALSKKEFST